MNAESLMRLTFINHACVKITAGSAVILCDPWLAGSAFNDGWDLMLPTPLPMEAVMQDVTHVWISHEHPDHFSIKFFNDIAPAWRDKVAVLFQRTRDGRVRDFIQKKGFAFREVHHDELAELGGGTQIRIGPNDFYDSWLWVSDGRNTLLNLNDCVVTADHDMQNVRQAVGRPDVLLTQFSYAAWKGGRDNAAYRSAAARQKLQIMREQIEGLQPRSVIPFASLAYFSNRENSYLNDRANTPEDARACIAAAGAAPVILYPGDDWTVGAPHDNGPPLARYAELFGSRHLLPLRESGKSVPMEDLETQFEQYRQGIFKKNSSLLIRLLRRLPVLRAFHPVCIWLPDLDRGVSVSVVDGLRPASRESCDVTMHSSSLSFIFLREFGYDTLTVNGRFEATPEAFGRMTRALSIGSLNAMGLAVAPSLLLRPHVVVILLARLRDVLARMRKSGETRLAESKSG